MKAVVSDSSPLNYLALLGDFDLLRRLFGAVIIPQAVYREVVECGSGYPVRDAVQAALGAWISVSEIPDPFRVQTLIREEKLDPGESEAIVIVEVLKPAALLMDEQRGVRCARTRGLTVIRTPLIYADARILGLIGSVREKLDQLRVQGFRLADEHYKRILQEVGEL